MINKIVHLADIHFRTYQRHVEFRAVCDYFLNKMEEIKPDRIVITGDIVHSRNQLTPELVNEVSIFLEECSKRTGKVIIIAGNHDIVEQNKDRMDALTPIISALDKDNIFYFKQSDLYKDENVIWTVFSIFDNNATPQNLAFKPYEGIYIGLYHGLIIGAENEKGFTFAHGVELNKFDDCDLTLCGDIHKRQVFHNKNKKPIIMVGSMIQQFFHETASQHGFCVITLDPYKHEFMDIDNPVKYLAFKINDIDDIENDNEILINA